MSGDKGLLSPSMAEFIEESMDRWGPRIAKIRNGITTTEEKDAILALLSTPGAPETTNSGMEDPSAIAISPKAFFPLAVKPRKECNILRKIEGVRKKRTALAKARSAGKASPSIGNPSYTGKILSTISPGRYR